MIGGGGGGRSSFDSASHGGSGSASGASRLADFLSNRSDSLSSSSGGLGLSTGLGLGSHVMPGGAPGAHGAGQPDGLSRSGSSLGDSTEHMRRAFGSFTDDEEGHAQLTESDEQTEDIADAELRMQELRLAAKVERKREAAKTRSKAGAFPPPEENYQFPPSPSVSWASARCDGTCSYVKLTLCWRLCVVRPRRTTTLTAHGSKADEV